MVSIVFWIPAFAGHDGGAWGSLRKKGIVPTLSGIAGTFPRFLSGLPVRHGLPSHVGDAEDVGGDHFRWRTGTLCWPVRVISAQGILDIISVQKDALGLTERYGDLQPYDEEI